ncbi:MAG: acetyl-CoA carboxylase biotin carboxylase subunit [Victivallales bacterium]|nr:acetyl-CoA carboxylase biotin carboxylase subunit [Victivallales bacterium]
MPAKILIANRGEIALRIIRACRELGMTSVIVYSEADRDSLPVSLADEAICIGPAPATKSYLKMDRVIAAAELAGADAIHPGYGFLSENAHFAEICEHCNYRFVGPRSEAIKSMGNKNRSREIMKAAGVPVTPGSDGKVTTLSEARDWARQLGYPVMLKAAIGGGGKGMRQVFDEADLPMAFESAQQEIRQAFASEELLVEKLILNPRHVEVQLVADNYGNVIHLGDRDCSLQRRHQKLIEEATCPCLDSATRAAICEAAVTAAKTVGYSNAGTVEFLLAPDGNFYFMEMNTRIQVEHPVTEEVTGMDIVREQLSVAFGEKLSRRQKDVKFSGHAIEMRINAEDAMRGFAPAPGTVKNYSAPGGPGVRIDSHICAGAVVSPYYDSLLAKLIVHAATREEAIVRARRAIREYAIDGVTSNVEFISQLLDMQAFTDGTYSVSTVNDFIGDAYSK